MKAILILFSLYLFACVRTTPIADAPHSPGIVSPDTVWIRTVDTVFVKGPVRIVYRDVEKVDAWGWGNGFDSMPINGKIYIDDLIPRYRQGISDLIGHGHWENGNPLITMSDSAFWKSQTAGIVDSIFVQPDSIR